jgi:2-oxo-4-hydroxy-4-carboxy-5-ureidoimidazoline decarboxylase
MNAITVSLDLESVNKMDRDSFARVLGSTFEHSPWVARDAWTGRPFETVDALHDAMMEVVRGAPRDTQVAFLRGHPELAGKEAQAGTMTSDSIGEQASAGLDALSRDEVAELRSLNARYRERHGFPFIIAVRRHGKADIFAMLRERIGGDSDGELREALRQVAIITRLRLEARLHA